MALQDIDSVNIPSTIYDIVSYDRFRARYVSKHPVLNEYNGVSTFTTGWSFFYGLKNIYYGNYVVYPYRVGIRIYIPTTYTNTSAVKITIGILPQSSYRNPYSEHVPSFVYNNLSLHRSLVNIQTAQLSSIFEDIDTIDLITSVSLINNDLTITLDSSIYNYFDNNSDGYIDFVLKATIEDNLNLISLNDGIPEQLNHNNFKLEIIYS